MSPCSTIYHSQTKIRSSTELTGHNMVGERGIEPYSPLLVSLERFELSPHGPKPCTLPGYAIESFFFHSLM